MVCTCKMVLCSTFGDMEVRLLHYLVLTSGRLATETGEETCFLKVIRKTLKSGYAIVSMVVGAVTSPRLFEHPSFSTW